MLASPHATLLVDPQSREIIAANEAASELYGYAVGSLTGMSLNELDPDLATRRARSAVPSPLAFQLARTAVRTAARSGSTSSPSPS